MTDRNEMMRRQQALADFGDFVLDHEDIDDILHEACRLVAQALRTDLAKVVEIEAGQNTGLIRAGIGWRPGIVGERRLSLLHRSSEAYAIEKCQPIITQDINIEDRFDFPEFLREHGVIALVNVPILLPGRKPWGVLQVDARTKREFDQEDVDFLKTYSMVLGPVIDRYRTVVQREEARKRLSEREERLNKVMDGMGEAFGILAADYTILEQNRQALKLDGRSREEIVGRSHWDVYPGSERSPVGQTLKRAMEQQMPTSLEHLYAWQDGHALWLEMRAYPTADGSLAVFWRDVTERRAAADALRESEERYRKLFESMDEAYAVVEVLKNSEGNWSDFLFIDVNPAFLEHAAMPWPVGKTATQLLGQPNPRWTELYGQALDTGKAIRTEEVEPTLGRIFDLNIFALDSSKNRVAVLFTNITERKRSEAALRESENRMRQFGEASQDVLWIRDSETLAWTYLTPAFEEIYGVSVAEALKGDTFGNWLSLIVPEDREHARSMIDRVRGGSATTFEYRILRQPDNQVQWVRNTDFPIRDAVGNVVSIGGIGHDMTSAKTAEERLATSEERLRNAVEIAKLALWDWDLKTGKVSWSDEHFRAQGYDVGQVQPSYEAWVARVHPDDRQQTEAAIIQARETGGDYVHEFRSLRPDGSMRWLLARGRFFYSGKGQAVRMIGAMLDTTDRREWEERQKVLVAELQHRTRNILSVIIAATERTIDSSRDLQDFRSRLRDRLDALARVQGLLSRLTDSDRVTFDNLIRSELAAMNSVGQNVMLSGPPRVRLRSSMVQTLALALHELATNAVKYGALGQPDARLEVRWQMTSPDHKGRPRLMIEWIESGVQMPPPGSSPQEGGQGRELIEKALPYQLGAKTTFTLGPNGVQCTIIIPVSETNQ